MIAKVAELKSSLLASGKVGLALDIDNTLSQTRNVYFTRFVEELGNPENLTFAEYREKYGHSSKVPYWQTEKGQALGAALTYDEDHHFAVTLVTGADESIRQIAEIIPIACYLTARPEVLERITKEWIAKHRLPKAPVILRPDYVQDENAWKADVLEYLFPQVTGIVDDHPLLPDRLSLGYKGTIYVYESPYPGREGLDIVHCIDWQNVVAEIKKRHQKTLPSA